MAIAFNKFFSDQFIDTRLSFPTKFPLKRFSLDQFKGAGGGFYKPGIEAPKLVYHKTRIFRVFVVRICILSKICKIMKKKIPPFISS
jgi:hypothetical protein